MASPNSWRLSSEGSMAVERLAPKMSWICLKICSVFHISGWTFSGAYSSRTLERMVET